MHDVFIKSLTVDLIRVCVVVQCNYLVFIILAQIFARSDVIFKVFSTGQEVWKVGLVLLETLFHIDIDMLKLLNLVLSIHKPFLNIVVFESKLQCFGYSLNPLSVIVLKHESCTFLWQAKVFLFSYSQSFNFTPIQLILMLVRFLYQIKKPQFAQNFILALVKLMYSLNVFSGRLVWFVTQISFVAFSKNFTLYFSHFSHDVFELFYTFLF